MKNFKILHSLPLITYFADFESPNMLNLKYNNMGWKKFFQTSANHLGLLHKSQTSIPNSLNSYIVNGIYFTGTCNCGSCMCHNEDNKGLIMGQFCECDDSECLDDDTGEVCGGMAVCQYPYSG